MYTNACLHRSSFLVELPMLVVSRVPLIHPAHTLMWPFGSSHIRVTRPLLVDLHRSASEKGIVSVHGSGAVR